MRVVGVDGFKDSWVVVVLSDGVFETAFIEPDLDAVVTRESAAVVIAVDIPIGSESDRFRQVDAAAKKFVGPRHSSVFATPPIEVFRQEGYAEACRRCRALTGGAPSKQAWQLGPKILHVDSVAARDVRLIEVHPEVSFCALLGGHAFYGKKSWAGHVVRRAALAHVGIVLPDGLGPLE